MHATGDRGREQCDGALALLGLPAQREHAVGDRGVEIPERWQLPGEISQVVALSHPDFIVIYGWFDPMWDVGSDAVAGDNRAGGK
jgi:hypothetical protein